MSEDMPDLDEEAIVAAVGSYQSLLPTSIDDVDRFMAEVHRITEARAQLGWDGEEQASTASVFLMFPYPREAKQKIRELGFTPINVTDLRPSGTAIFGRVFILDAAASNGCYVPLPVDPGDISEWIKEIGFDRQPVAIAWRGTRVLTQRPNGIDDTCRQVTIRDAIPVASIENLLEALKAFHETTLETPGKCQGVWTDAANYLPGEAPEKAIQYSMRIALATALSLAGVRAEEEDKCRVGRIDIRLLAPAAEGPLCYWAIIELKVIKSKRLPRRAANPPRVSRKANIDTIIEGVVQTSEYMRDRKTNEGLLEVFDLREAKDENLLLDSKVVECVSQGDPAMHINLRPLHGSARETRTAEFSKGR